ncbi:g8698 [Coccomyxa elongata]
MQRPGGIFFTSATPPLTPNRPTAPDTPKRTYQTSMASSGLRFAGALLAVCLIGVVSAQDEATKLESIKSVYLPTTTNDYGGMIYSLLAEQANFLAAKDGAATEGSPLNLLTSMASWAANAQTALFNMAPSEGGTTSQQSLPSTPLPDPLSQLLNVTASWGTIIGNSHADPVPQNLLNFLLENPIGPQLDAALKALPTVTDPVLLANATANFGNSLKTGSVTVPGVPAIFNNGGGNTVFSQSANVVAYRPCFVSEGATGVQVSTQLIVVNPRAISSSATGVAITPKLIEVQPTLIKVKPVGVNVSPTGIQVIPKLINIGPQVAISYPATPAAKAPAAGRH